VSFPPPVISLIAFWDVSLHREFKNTYKSQKKHSPTCVGVSLPPSFQRFFFQQKSDIKAQKDLFLKAAYIWQIAAMVPGYEVLVLIAAFFCIVLSCIFKRGPCVPPPNKILCRRQRIPPDAPTSSIASRRQQAHTRKRVPAAPPTPTGGIEL
jgi:hypothetical protein